MLDACCSFDVLDYYVVRFDSSNGVGGGGGGETFDFLPPLPNAFLVISEGLVVSG